MNNFIKLHWGLIRFLNKELRKKRTSRETVFFLKDILKVYFTQLIKLYNNMFLVFDTDYQKQKKKQKQYNELKKQLNQALKLLKYIDKKMLKQGLSRQKRRQFWRDFSDRGELRKKTFDELSKELE